MDNKALLAWYNPAIPRHEPTITQKWQVYWCWAGWDGKLHYEPIEDEV